MEPIIHLESGSIWGSHIASAAPAAMSAAASGTSSSTLSQLPAYYVYGTSGLGVLNGYSGAGLNPPPSSGVLALPYQAGTQAGKLLKKAYSP